MPGSSGNSLRRYRKVAIAATASLTVIIASGAAVRLTQSGLGCEDWPTCSDDSFLPEAEDSVFHAWVEFGNRLFTGVVAAAVVLAVLTAYRLRPVRRDLRRWAWGLVVGVLVQIVVGAITVRTELNPLSVTTHFLISMVLLWNGLVLVHLAGSEDPESVWRRRPLAWTLLGWGGLVLVTGTIVTGTGPNSGDVKADRLSFDLEAVARIHSLTVWAFLALVVAYAWSHRHSGPVRTPLHVLLAAIIAQGAVGYVQFGLGVPPGLVQLHVIGSVVVWSATVWLFVSSPLPMAPSDPTTTRERRTPVPTPAGADFSP